LVLTSPNLSFVRRGIERKVAKGPEIANRQMVKRDFFIGKKIPPTPFIKGA
jgi:hypothetical protein